MKSMKKFKVIGGIAATVVVLCIVIVAVFKFKGGTEDYRNISVFELEASATVTRDGTALDAYPGMKLMNGDNIKVGNEGYICLLLDDDKYVTLETGTEIQLNATGNSQNSKTTIELVQGAVLNELDSKLNADSSYELSTPVSVMAVRGTVFRAAMTENGEASSLDLIVLDGKVATSAVLPDGSISSEENLVGAGQGARFEKADAQSDPVYSPMDVSYEDLPAQTIAMILKIYESGRINLSIQEDELRKLYTQKTASADDANEPSEDDLSDTADDKQEDTSSDPQEISDADDSDDTDNTDNTDNSNDSDNSVNTENASGGSSQTAQSANRDSDTGSGVKPTAKPEAKPNTKKAAEKDNKATAKPTSIPNAITPTAQPDTGSQTNPSTAAPSSQPENKVYTVTFIDSLGRTFGTQSIAAGSRAQKPKLSPAGGTSWYDSDGNTFDFNTAVTSDLTLYYR